MRRELGLFAGLVVLSLSCAILSIVSAQNNSPLRVAANLPFTGDLAVYGQAIRDGSTMALAEKASDKSLIAYDWQDNSGDNQRAVLIARQQLAAKPNVYMSGLKPQTVAVQPQVAAAGVVHFPWILDITLNKAAADKLNFRVWISFRLELDVFKKILDVKHPKRVALWYVNTEAAVEEYARGVAPYAKGLGAEVMEEVVQSESTDYRATAARIKAFNPDFIFLNGFIPNMVAQVKALAPLGLMRPGQTVGGLDLLDAAPLLPPEQIEGVLVAAPAYLVASTPAATNWAARYEKLFGSRPTYHAAYAYDTATAIILAAEGARSAPVADWQSAFVAKLRQTNFEGITGPIKLDADQSLDTSMVLTTFRKGLPVLVRP